MHTLDSRVLRYVDCFAQRFATPGEVAYRITTTAGARVALDAAPFTIRVKKAPPERREGEQYVVTVKRDGLRFAAEPPELEITAGDTVLWHAPDPKTPGYVVCGKGAGGEFDSTALATETVYTHAFGMPGEYKWTDANGSGIAGLVRVRQVDSREQRQMTAWAEQVKEGALVVISGRSVEPKEVDILVGQTVFFAVEKAPGITITDSQLMMSHAPSTDRRSERRKAKQ
jgi:plastocyanin